MPPISTTLLQNIRADIPTRDSSTGDCERLDVVPFSKDEPVSGGNQLLFMVVNWLEIEPIIDRISINITTEMGISYIGLVDYEVSF